MGSKLFFGNKPQRSTQNQLPKQHVRKKPMCQKKPIIYHNKVKKWGKHDKQRPPMLLGHVSIVWRRKKCAGENGCVVHSVVLVVDGFLFLRKKNMMNNNVVLMLYFFLRIWHYLVNCKKIELEGKKSKKGPLQIHREAMKKAEHTGTLDQKKNVSNYLGTNTHVFRVKKEWREFRNSWLWILRSK